MFEWLIVIIIMLGVYRGMGKVGNVFLVLIMFVASVDILKWNTVVGWLVLVPVAMISGTLLIMMLDELKEGRQK
jgi:hypothetical protein